MEMKQISSEYSLTDSENNVVGVAKVEKYNDDASLELSLGDKLKFGSKEEVASFLNQILNIME
jgi:hypothetical protein